MSLDEFKEFVAKNDKLNGNYVRTLNNTKRRERRINEFYNNEKFMFLLNHIIKSGVRFMLFEDTQKKGANAMFTDIYVPKYRICIRYDNVTEKSHDKCQLFYAIKRVLFYPVFIRENESKEFLVEKYDNTVTKAVKEPKSHNIELPCTKKKRERIKFIKVNN